MRNVFEDTFKGIKNNVLKFEILGLFLAHLFMFYQFFSFMIYILKSFVHFNSEGGLQCGVKRANFVSIMTAILTAFSTNNNY